MKYYLFLFIIITSGCASIPVNIYNKSALSKDVVNETYVMAQDIFKKTTGCMEPKDKNITIYNASLVDLNRDRNVFTSSGMSFIIGEYKSLYSVIYLVGEHPDQSRILFHEFLHFIFDKSSNCKWANDIDTQHKIIPFMETEYFNQKHKLKDIGNNWLYNTINKIK